MSLKLSRHLYPSVVMHWHYWTSPDVTSDSRLKRVTAIWSNPSPARIVRRVTGFYGKPEFNRTCLSNFTLIHATGGLYS
jgi:hypothetical protein